MYNYLKHLSKIFLIDFLISIIGVLLRIALFTLIERKIIGIIHYRKGPNKVSLIGILQPFSDAIKLFTKQFLKPYKTIILFYLGPLLRIFLIFLC